MRSDMILYMLLSRKYGQVSKTLDLVLLQACKYMYLGSVFDYNDWI